jgi:prefoldin subunit 5
MIKEINVSLEAAASSWIIKLIWIPIIGPILAWIVKKIVTDVYTKAEVDTRIQEKVQVIERRVDLLAGSLDKNTNALEKLSSCISSLDKRLAIEEEKSKWRK